MVPYKTTPRGGRPTNRPTDDILTKLYADHTAKEIADLYNVKPSTVKNWLAKSRKEAKEKEN